MTATASRGPALLSAAAMIAAGIAMSIQGTANGHLAAALGHGLYAAFLSFTGGFVVLCLAIPFAPAARRGLGRAWQLVRRREFPWWMLTGGIGGASVVIAQSLTVPLFGVATFIMSFVCGQLLGGLIVDNTHLSPGGRRAPSVPRVAGVIIVLIGVIVSSSGALSHGVPLWAPLLPLTAGALTAFQQAFNGNLNTASRSAYAATFTNFLVGSLFLFAAAVIVRLSGVPISGFPEMPGQWWMLIGGVLGVMYIGFSTVAVGRLGVLLISLLALFGNLLGSLVIDLLFPVGAAPIGPQTFIAIGLVLLGVVVASIQRRQRWLEDDD